MRSHDASTCGRATSQTTSPFRASTMRPSTATPISPVLLGRESERFVQFVVGGDARAARAEFLAGALVDRYVPADLAKEQPREQTADRSTDDDGAFSPTCG